MSNMAVGVIHGVTLDITEYALVASIHSRSIIVRARCLGQFQSVTLRLTSATLTEVVLFKTYLSMETPIQCANCGRL